MVWVQGLLQTGRLPICFGSVEPDKQTSGAGPSQARPELAGHSKGQSMNMQVNMPCSAT